MIIDVDQRGIREQVEAYETRVGRNVKENYLHRREKQQMDNINKRFKSLQEMLESQSSDLKSIKEIVEDLKN